MVLPLPTLDSVLVAPDAESLRDENQWDLRARESTPRGPGHVSFPQ